MLPYNALVKLFNTSSPSLDGKYARIRGIASKDAAGTSYIIEMYEPLENGYTNLVLTEYCMEKV